MATQQVVVRLVLTVALLVMVWMNSHWSVALSLSLICAEVECRHLLKRRS
jgi:hypothetical protein